MADLVEQLSSPAGHLAALGVTLLAAALATAVVRTLARRLDFVSRPAGERWSTRAVPLGGGVGIFCALLPGLLLADPDLAVGAGIVFLLGLVDDRRPLSPPVKLVVQTVASCWVVAAPLAAGEAALLFGRGSLLFAEPAFLAIPVTVAWYVGVANSVNLLDNMDGSAAGVAAIAAAFVYLLAVGGELPDPALAVASVAAVGACAGFLVHNFPPARVYMGDAGSLLLGFALAGLAVRLPADPDQPWRSLAVPVVVLGAPLFDTALVWFTRRAARRPFLEGGRDHTTHRLMALGLSERRTLLVLYGGTAALGGVGLAVARGGIGLAVPTLVLGGIALVLLGVFLGDVSVYRPRPGEAAVPRVRSPALLYAVELAVDVAVLSACWIGAYAIRFEEADLGFYLSASALPALPFVIAFKVVALLWFDLYRGFWRTIAFADVAAIAKAITLATLLVIVVATGVVRFEHYSRGVFAIDWLLSLVGVVASRSALRYLRDALARLAQVRRPAVLLGPPGVRPLVEATLAEARLDLVDVVAPGDPDATLAAVRAAEPQVLLVADGRPDDDPLLRALAGEGLQVRRVRAVLD